MVDMTKERAIELLVNATYSEEWQGNEELTLANQMAIQSLNEHKQGKWIYMDTCYECSVCHSAAGLTTDFCPDCGADMRGVENG